MKKFLKMLLLSCFCAAICVTVALFDSGRDVGTGVSGTVLGASEAQITLVDADGKSDYVVIYGTNDGAQKFAYDLVENMLYKRYSASLDFYSNSKAEGKREILYGVTSRQISVDLVSAINKRPADSHVWGMAYKDGKLALYASSDVAVEKLIKDLEEIYFTDDGFKVPENLWVINEITAKEYEDFLAEQERLEAEEREKRRREKIDFYKNAIATEFDSADFGPYITNMTEATKTVYDSIEQYPTVGEHPRVLVNAEMVEKIREQIALTNSAAESSFLSVADSEIANDGKLPAATASGVRGFNNFDLGILRVIQTKAFAYLITGDELYAVEAVYAMKNYLVTLDVQWITSDGTREFGYCMYIVACVYDWCYDMLSAEDKFQLTAGVEHILCTGTVAQPDKGSYGGVKMEIGFPPSEQGVVVGHGAERALLRDYLSVAIAIYDEEPSWYDYVGGRFYDQYVPTRNEFYKSGMVPQGVCEYAPGRFMSDLYSAMLIYAMSGVNPYDDGMAKVALSFTAHETYGGKVFSQGDLRIDKDKLVTQIGYCAVMTAYLYDDLYSLAISKELKHGYSTFYSGTFNISPVETLICMQNGIEPAESRYDGMNTIVYNGGTIGQIIARKAYNDKSSPITLMKIGVRTSANHDHQASGIFQIYYKGLLTGDTGVYDSYGTAHHKHYHQATISHNSLLIYNPAFEGENSGYYSGGQRQLGEPKSYERWMQDDYKTAQMLGYAYGYKQNGDAKYSYVSGDITPAYDAETVDYVSRSMLTVFTDDPTFPMVLFVFDRIDTPDPTFKKTFLFHITGSEAPTVDGNTVTTVNGDGKLVLQSLLGGDVITPLGGEGNNYLVNGVQLTSKTDDDTWGRVEISPNAGNKSDLMLNVMYVTDKDETKTLPAQLLSVSTSNAEAAKIGNVVAVFGNGMLPESKAITVDASGEGMQDYYFTNLAVGTWSVYCDGERLGTVYSTDNAKAVRFRAPAGVITLEPTADVESDAKSKIKYVTDGGVIPDDAPIKYTHGTVTALPESATRGTDLFLGWYSDPEFTNKITEIPDTAEGLFTVYARWSRIYVNEDYTTYKFSVGTSYVDELTDITSSSSIGQGISLNGGNGALNTLKVDNEKGTLTWTADGKGPAINVNSASYPFSKLDSHSISFEIRLGKLQGVSNMKLNLRVRDKDKAGTISLGDISGSNVTLGGVTIATLSETEFTTIRIVLDFANAKVYAYDANGGVITSSGITPPAGYASALDWQKAFTKEVFNMYAAGAGTIVIGHVLIAEGNLYGEYTYNDPSNNVIVYPADATLPEGAPTTYKSSESTALPESATKDGFRFEGWYSDEALSKRITAIPAGSVGEFKVYAKWLRVYANESWDSYEIDQSGVASAGTIGSGIGINGGNSATNDIKSDNANGTLTWTVSGKGPGLIVKNKNYPIASLTENQLTVEMSLAKAAGANAPKITFRIRDNGKANTLTVATLAGNTLSVGGTDVLTLTESPLTVRIVIDFEAEKIYVYDENLNGIASADMTVPAGFENGIAWRANFTSEEVLNGYAGGGGTLVMGHILVIEGNAYGDYKYVNPDGNIIVYPADVTLPDDAPVSYETGKGVALPTTATRSGYYFMGWYADEALTTPITAVPSDAVGEFKVYAKWSFAYVTESYDEYSTSQSGVTSLSNIGSGGLALNSGNARTNDVVTDNEKGVLIWTSTGDGPAIVVNNKNNTLSTRASGIISFEFSFEYAEGIDMLNLHIRTRDVNKQEISLARVTNGVVSFGGQDIYTVTPDTQVTLRFVVDFNNATVCFYDEALNAYHTRSFSWPADYASAADWFKVFTNKEIVNIRAEDGGTILVHHIVIAEGNIYGDYVAPEPAPEEPEA